MNSCTSQPKELALQRRLLSKRYLDFKSPDFSGKIRYFSVIEFIAKYPLAISVRPLYAKDALAIGSKSSEPNLLVKGAGDPTLG